MSKLKAPKLLYSEVKVCYYARASKNIQRAWKIWLLLTLIFWSEEAVANRFPKASNWISKIKSFASSPSRICSDLCDDIVCTILNSSRYEDRYEGMKSCIFLDRGYPTNYRKDYWSIMKNQEDEIWRRRTNSEWLRNHVFPLFFGFNANKNSKNWSKAGTIKVGLQCIGSNRQKPCL